jgi:hypothetical protein
MVAGDWQYSLEAEAATIADNSSSRLQQQRQK